MILDKFIYNCINGLDSCLYLRFSSKALASLGLLGLIHCDSFTENVKLTSAPSPTLPQGVEGVETALDTQWNSL